MKIQEYKQMMSYLTRPDNKTPEERKAMEDKKIKEETDRRNKKRAEHGLPPKDIFDGIQDTFVKEYNLNDAEPGQEIIVGPNGQIMMESELKKQIEKEETKYLKSVYPEKATPEQVGKLAENLERQKQMTKAPTKPIKKIKKISTPIQIDPSIPSVTTLNSSKIQDQVTKVPEARSTVSVENDPRFRNTIFGSDTYWRRKRGL